MAVGTHKAWTRCSLLVGARQLLPCLGALSFDLKGGQSGTRSVLGVRAMARWLLPSVGQVCGEHSAITLEAKMLICPCRVCAESFVGSAGEVGPL